MHLEDYGLTVPRKSLATTAAEAVEQAEQLGWPVVLKIASPDIIHKTDVGGVALNLTSAAHVRTAFLEMIAMVEQHAPAARIDGATVEEWCPEGVEIMIGLIRDDQFGPCIMLGLGGVWAEILSDVSFRVLPITPWDARQMLSELRGAPLLAGYRGQPPVSQELIVDLLMKAQRLALDLGERLDAVDLNPIRVWSDRHMVLDAKVLLNDESRPISTTQPNTAHLSGFFDAKSVAVIGASATPGKVGNAVLDSLANYEYRGQVYPVNPTRDTLMGRRAWPSLAAIPEPVDLVVVTVPLAQVPGLLRGCAARGIHNMVVISGGGKELGGAYQELESEIRRLALSLDVRVVGPNCIGVFDGPSRLDVFFQVRERMLRPPCGPAAVITQSGTVGAAVMEDLDAAGISRFVSYGNRVDVDEADLLTYLGEDPATQVIACYIEGLEDGRKFLAAAARVSERKPIVLFKGGRTRRGARAAVSHTGFFGGTYGIVAGALKQAGIIAVDSIEELSAVTRALAQQPCPAGNRVAMISNGAGTMVQAIDLMETYGLELAPVADATIAALKQVYPPYYVVQNPVDVTGSATAEDYRAGIEALLQDPNVDTVMPWFVFQDTPLGEEIVDALAGLSHKYGKPILCGRMGGPYTARMAQAIETAGVPVYRTVREWVAAAAGPARWAAWRKRV
jgi:3-hydroxypropionyl-CoA synthetase (ADP-forming)